MSAEYAPRLRLELWTAGYQRAGWISEWDNLDVTVPRIGPAAGTWTVPADTAPPALYAPGTRVVVSYQPGGAQADGTRWPWVQQCSGTMRVRASGPASRSRYEVSLVDDWAALAVQAWPVPAAALTAQSSEYWRASGPAETVIRSLVVAAATRTGIPLTVPTSAGRGATVTAAARMRTVGDVVAELAAAGGIGVRVQQVSGGLSLVVSTGTDRSWLALSERSGNVGQWAWQITPPTVTRAVVGGPGEGTARQFVAVVDSVAEAAYGAPGKPYVREVFVDARDVEAGAGAAAILTARGQAAIAEGAAAVDGVDITIAESDSVRYGATLDVGDLVRVDLIPGLSRTTRVTEARITAATGSDGGISVVPAVGDPTVGLPERAQAQLIAALTRGLASLRAR